MKKRFASIMVATVLGVMSVGYTAPALACGGYGDPETMEQQALNRSVREYQAALRNVQAAIETGDAVAIADAYSALEAARARLAFARARAERTQR